MGLVLQLERLVQASNAPLALLYVTNHLSWGDPTLSFCFNRSLCYVHMLVFQGLFHAMHNPRGEMPLPLERAELPVMVPVEVPQERPVPGGKGKHPSIARQEVPPAMPFPVGQGGDREFEQLRLMQQQLRRELDIRQEAQRLLLQTQLRETIEKIVKDKPDLLCQKIRQGTPLERFVAVQVISRRRLPLEKELIDVLSDPDKMVRQAAHDALVHICRGTDFGPKAGVSKRGLARAVEQWRRWLDLQRSVVPTRSSDRLADAPVKPKEIDLSLAVKFVTERGDPEFGTDATEAPRLSAELTTATGLEQTSMLVRLRDAKGVENTDALALAIPKLSGQLKQQTRDALTQRLARMTAATLRDKLQDDNDEVRCAAVLACGRKKAKEHIPDLLQLLDDPEMDVILSARMVLIELTGEDFGPSSDAGRRDRTDAANAWRNWWKANRVKR
ncbi:MAG: HEAT repeat domain-containing protein [Gemmataceae bacterium]